LVTALSVPRLEARLTVPPLEISFVFVASLSWTVMIAVLVPLAGRLVALTSSVELVGEATRALGIAEAVPDGAPTPAALTALKATS
jgi:hypothetical protein